MSCSSEKILLLSLFFFIYSYVQHPSGGEVTEDFLVSGNYEIEVMGTRYPATMYLKSPFDSSNKRASGYYEG